MGVEMKYVLDIEKLESSDIILTRNNKLTSRLIRYFTEGEFSHALIYVSHSSVIEATREGRVFAENTQRLVFDNLDDCKVFRCKQTLNDNIKRKIEYFVRGQVSTLYSVKEAIRVRKLGNSEVDALEGTQFCSRLVAQAYSHAGIQLVSNQNYCSPQDLNDSEQLIEVENVLRDANAWDLTFASTPNPIKENANQLYMWLDKASEIAKAENFDVLSQYDIEQFIMDYPQYDEVVCGYILETDYLNFYRVDEFSNPARYNYDPMISFDIVSEFEMNKSLVSRYLINYSRSKSIVVSKGLKYYELQVQLFENLLKQCIGRLGVIIEYIDFHIHKEFDSVKLLHMNEYKSNVENLIKNIKFAFNENGFLKYIEPSLT